MKNNVVFGCFTQRTNISYIWPPEEIYRAIFMKILWMSNWASGRVQCAAGCSWCCRAGGWCCRRQTPACYCMLHQQPLDWAGRAPLCSSSLQALHRPWATSCTQPVSTTGAAAELQFDQSLIISALSRASHAPISPSQGYLENKCNLVYIIR